MNPSTAINARRELYRRCIHLRAHKLNAYIGEQSKDGNTPEKPPQPVKTVRTGQDDALEEIVDIIRTADDTLQDDSKEIRRINTPETLPETSSRKSVEKEKFRKNLKNVENSLKIENSNFKNSSQNSFLKKTLPEKDPDPDPGVYPEVTALRRTRRRGFGPGN